MQSQSKKENLSNNQFKRQTFVLQVIDTKNKIKNTCKKNMNK